MDSDVRLTPDGEAEAEMLEMMSQLRTQGYVIDRLDSAPLHVPGCDDVHNRFAWYSRTNPSGELEGYFHLRKEVDF